MAKERDEYIQRLMDKAEQQRQSEARATRTATSVRKPRASSPTVSRPSATRSAATEPARGKNGRQAVAPIDERRRAQPSKTRPTAQREQPSSVNATQGGASPAKSVRPNAPKQVAENQSEAHIWFSLFLIFVSLYLAMSTVSYLIYFSADEYLAYFQYLFDFKAVGAQNWGGKLGAIIGNLCIGRSFGIMGIGVPVITMIWAIKVLRVPTLQLRKATRSTLILMLTGSVVLGQFAGVDPTVFGSGYGGELGIYVAQWLQQVIGFEGTTLFVLLAGLGILYFVNSGWIRSFVAWIAERMEHNRLQRAARAMAQRERDDLLREQLARQAAAQMATRTTPTPIPATAPAVVAAPAPIEPTQPPVVSTAEQALEPEQVQGELKVESTWELAVEEPVQEPKRTAVDPSALIELQGDQWGYIFDWDVDGTPVYCYFDRSTMAAMASANAQQMAARASMVVASQLQKAEAKIEEHDVEFIVKSYASADLPSMPQEQEQLVVAGAPIVEQTVAEAAAIAVSNSVSTPTLAPEPVQTEPKKAYFAPSADDPNFIVEQSSGDEQLDDRTINLTELYDPTRELASYKKPPVELLKDHSRRVSVSPEELVENKNKIVHTLETFGIKIDTIEATIGPTVTLYEIIPAPGVRISKIKNLEDDIALSLSALGIRIIAPIPGRGTIGIEVPNKDKETVSMYSVIKSAKFQESKFDLPIALGKTIQNETFVLDLAKMPHLLVAGATGQGKSVGLNAILTSLLYKKHPSELKFILVDPKKVELTLYAKLEKHFLAKMPGEEEAIITDTQKVIYTLNSICVEMDARYDLLKAAKVRNIAEYNDKFTHRHLNPEKGHRFLPYFVVIIDEFADLIMTAGREVETPIARIAQLARAVGIHLIIATQRPTTNIITGVIKANFPARIAFRVTSMIDSRTILDSPGANQLVGRGDMLVSTGSEVTRVQCAFIDTPEVDEITEFISSQRGYVSAYELPEYVPESEQNGLSKDIDTSKRDPLFEDVARFVVSNQSGSASTIQRKYSIGFNRAGRLIDQLEAAGIVGRADGSKARQVLVQDPISLEMLLDG